jgi:carboxypeptidase family protein
MGIRNIVWTAADRVKWLALVGVIAAAACSGKASDPTDILAPSQGFLRPETFSLSGTVLTAGDEGAVPVEGARVEISSGEVFETYTDAEGRYTFGNIARTSWRLLVQKEGYADSLTEVDLSSGPANVDVMLEPMAQ